MDRPIIFSGSIIRALLDGRKTMTRRILRWQPPEGYRVSHLYSEPAGIPQVSFVGENIKSLPRIEVAKAWSSGPVGYAVGDRLWVKEAYYQFGHWEPVPGVRTKAGRMKWRFVKLDDVTLFDAPAEYRKGRHHKDPDTPAWHLRLARFMPRRYSRTTLTVTSVKVERLQEISEEDARAEGVWSWSPEYREKVCIYRDSASVLQRLPIEYFERLWASIHGPDAWAANPFVVAIGFNCQRGNIDQVQQ